MDPMFVPGSSTIAGLFFVTGFIFGMWGGNRLGAKSVWPAIIVGIACCFVRGFSVPLGVAAVGSVTLLHVCIAALMVAILRTQQTVKAIR